MISEEQSWRACQIGAPIIGVIAFLCSITTIYLIRKMKLNGFLLILLSLSVCQMVYDIAFLFLIGGHDDWYLSMFLLFDLAGELSVAIWTVLLSIIMFRIVYTLKTVNIYREYPVYLTTAITVPLVLDILALSLHRLDVDPLSTAYRIYYWMRLIAVIVNIVLFIITNIIVLRLYKRVEAGILTVTQAECIRILVQRMRWYSVVQILLRVGPSWYENNSQTLQSAPARIVYFFTAPATGIGYFLVFLVMQPGATHILIDKINTFFPFFNKYLPNNEVTDTDDRESYYLRETMESVWDETELMGGLELADLQRSRANSRRFTGPINDNKDIDPESAGNNNNDGVNEQQSAVKSDSSSRQEIATDNPLADGKDSN